MRALDVRELCCPFLLADKEGNSRQHRVSLGVETLALPREGMCTAWEGRLYQTEASPSKALSKWWGQQCGDVMGIPGEV